MTTDNEDSGASSYGGCDNIRPRMKFEEMLAKYVGNWGRYQKMQILLVSIPTLFTAIHGTSWTFTSAKLKHRCTLPGEGASWPFDPSGQGGLGKLSVPLSNLSCSLPQGWALRDFFGRDAKDSRPWMACTAWKYDFSSAANSATAEFSIVCDREWIRAFVQSTYFVGQFFGSYVFGVLGDKLGRKKVFLVANLVQCLSAAGLSAAPDWRVFAVLRSVVGFCHPGILNNALVISMELVGKENRKICGVIVQGFYAVGLVILGSAAYGIRDYVKLQLAISLPGLIFFSYYWVIPESARWLISQQRYSEAGAVLRAAAKSNGRLLPDHWVQQLGEVRPPPFVRFNPIIANTPYYAISHVTGVYYGLSMNPMFLGGDPYLTFIGGGLMEIPGLVISYVALDRLGRRLLCFLGFLVCALCLFSTLIVPEGMAWLKAVQVVLSKSAITTVYATVYTWTPELFPTAVRGSALGSCSMLARLGAFSASYVAFWLTEVSKSAVVLIFGAAALSACGACVFLPETAGEELPETLDDIRETELCVQFPGQAPIVTGLLLCILIYKSFLGNIVDYDIPRNNSRTPLCCLKGRRKGRRQDSTAQLVGEDLHPQERVD